MRCVNMEKSSINIPQVRNMYDATKGEKIPSKLKIN